MEKVSEEFLAWAEDPARSVEERYGIVRLTEYVYRTCYRGADKVQRGYEEERQMREDRCYDAAYDPVPDAAMLRITAEFLPGLTKLELETHLTDRPIRDLGVLAFVPGIEELKLKDIEMDRLEALRHVPKLRRFHIRADGVGDYRDLALCRELRSIGIQTWHPWPVLDGLETLPHLERLEWLSNGRSLAGIRALPNLKSLSIDWPGHHAELANCVRDLHQLPEMPRLELLWGGWFYRLEGIGRFPRLRVVCIKGYFKSLAPLAELKEVTHLRVVSPWIEEVATVAGMASVFQFAIQSVRPQDWSPLFDSVTLRDVIQNGCEAPQPDFHTLRMLLPPRTEMFGSEEPRPHEPLRFRIRPETEVAGGAPPSPQFPDGPAGWDGCLAMRQSEARWVKQELAAALEQAGLLKLKGVRFEVDEPESHYIFNLEPRAHLTRHADVHLLRTEAIGRLRSIVECLRPVLLRARYPWQVGFTLSPEADAEEWDESWRRDDSPESRIRDLLEEEREAERSRQRRRLFLHDEQRLRLLKELGHDAGEFRRSALPPEEEAPEIIIRAPSKGRGKDKKDSKKDDNDGGLAEADPNQPDTDENWLPPVEISDPNIDWNRLYLYFTLTEDAVWIAGRKKNAIAALSYLLDLAPEYPDGCEPEPDEDDD